MDWIRRNWPDLVIGLALLAVIVGIIATLLNGGSFFRGTPSLSAGTSPSAPASTAATESSQSSITEAPGIPSAPNTPSVSASLEEANAAAEAAGSDTPIAEGTDAATAGVADGITPLVPGAGDAASPDTAVASGDAPGTALAETESATTIGLDAAELAAPFRIVVGSYRDAANAERQVETFRGLGYPAFTGTQDDLTLALVGPYEVRGEAEAALTRLQSDGLVTDPQLFELGPDGVGAAVSSSNQETSSAAPAAPAATPEAASGAATAYIQTGAYGSSEAAQPQRARLEGLGFSVSEVQEGSFLKLLVGPFNASELEAAQARLRSQGVDHFVRGN